MSSTADPVERQRRALLELIQLDTADFDAALSRALELDARALEAERVSFWRLSEDRSRITCERLYCLSTGVFHTTGELAAAEYPRYFAALLEHQAIRADDARVDPRTAEFERAYFPTHGITSLLDVPVWRGGALVGVLCHEQVGPARRWQDSEVDFALSVGGMISLALEARARRQAEARYELLTTALQDFVWDWDLRTDHIAWSEGAPAALRFRQGELGPSLQWWQTHVHPDDVQRVVGGLNRHAAGGHGIWRDEYRFRRGDGTWAIILDRGVLQRDAEGKPLRMVGSMTDITEQRELEARVALSERMVSVGTLAAGVAHEINNPLTFIHGNVSYALRALERLGLHRSEVREALSEALSGVERVQRIVVDLKTLSRPDERTGPVDPVAALQSAVGIVSNELTHRARLIRELHPVPKVLGNAARLGQVFINLLMNAAQAIPDGRAEEHEIRLRTGALPSGRVLVEIEDTGHGIPPEVLPRVFDPFFTTKRFGDGTGLGLTICHSLVSAMGGQLTLENNPGRGARARLELLPAAGDATDALAAVAPLVPPRTRGRVLIIDDVVNVTITMRRLLDEFHDVETMNHARGALEAIGGGARWDVILCDLMMPDLNGMDFAREVQRCCPELWPRIVLMSGGAFTASAEEFLRGWPHRSLEKPIRPQTLLEAVDAAVTAARST